MAAVFDEGMQVNQEAARLRHVGDLFAKRPDVVHAHREHSLWSQQRLVEPTGAPLELEADVGGHRQRLSILPADEVDAVWCLVVEAGARGVSRKAPGRRLVVQKGLAVALCAGESAPLRQHQVLIQVEKGQPHVGAIRCQQRELVARLLPEERRIAGGVLVHLHKGGRVWEERT